MLFKPQKETRVLENTSFEPLTTLLRQTMPSEQVSKKVKKYKNDTSDDSSTSMGTRPR